MARHSRHALLLIGTGVVVRLILAFTTTGQAYDLQSVALVDKLLRTHTFAVYHQLDNYSMPPYGRWPYPPGFFLAVVPIGWLARLTGLAFTSLIRTPSILADAGIAWLAQYYLGRHGRNTRDRLGAVALVSLGPSFIAISGYHGQIDSVAFLPCVAAVVLWSETEADWRPFAAGALVGLGAAVKTVPLLTVLALAPSARSWQEAAKLVATAVVIPLAAFAPWLILDGPGKSLVWRYRGGPGLGGISLITNPSLPLTPFTSAHGAVTGATKFVYDQSRWITGVALAATTVFLIRHRPPPVESAALIWLTVWGFGVSFFLQYLVWGLPFLIMAGYLRQVVALQAALLPATIITYATGVRPWEVWSFYTAPMIAFWVVTVGAALLLAQHLTRERGELALVGHNRSS